MKRAAFASAARRQRGMGLVELMIVILISMFMMAGLLSVVYGTRQNFTAQNQLAQLQDSERLAMTIVGSVVQQGGYYPNPNTVTASAAFPTSAYTDSNSATTSYATAGQSVVGSGAGTGTDDIWVRYTTSGTDDVMDCNGQTNGVATTFVNHLYISGGTLWCASIWGTTAQPAQPLVAGVTAMNIVYGVNTSGLSPPAASRYLTATAVTTGSYWNAVVSAQVRLTFKPNAIVTVNGSSGANDFSGWTPTITRTIDLLNHV